MGIFVEWIEFQAALNSVRSKAAHPTIVLFDDRFQAALNHPRQPET
ncbi:hypothetical protein [Kingella sp. (in: b-proteobacteria)]|nr:hypothetical protein [Kingella sp. (in: b-proteobacteria)]MDO4656531.1 hypothetical protein [Kingella sp. (in: b-proteobacteria)]